MPEAMVRVRKYAVGAFDDWKIEARFSGPANADPATLRRLAEEGMDILRDTPNAKEVRSNWRKHRCLHSLPKMDRGAGRYRRESLATTWPVQCNAPPMALWLVNIDKTTI